MARLTLSGRYPAGAVNLPRLRVGYTDWRSQILRCGEQRKLTQGQRLPMNLTAVSKPTGPHPVIGMIWPDEVGEILESPFGLFDCSEFGITGLANIRKEHTLQLLAITSLNRGQGNFGRMLAKCMENYRRIEIVAVMNARFATFLSRIGFTLVEHCPSDMKPLYQWNRPQSTSPNDSPNAD